MKPSIAIAAFIASCLAAHPALAESKTLTVAGGCFWCVEHDFDHVKGVTNAVSGYAGGEMQNPTYRNHGRHREVVRITYDSNVTDYKTLVLTFLRTIDPLDAGGQFCDRGRSYAPAIHASTEAEMKAAREAVAQAEADLGREVVVPIEGDVTFWKAEDYHQNYAKSSEKVVTRFGVIDKADAYKKYRKGCGRDARVKQIWGDMAYQGVDKAGS
jgi:peptide-methionine (S)-S-oxide reductase